MELTKLVLFQILQGLDIPVRHIFIVAAYTQLIIVVIMLIEIMVSLSAVWHGKPILAPLLLSLMVMAIVVVL